MGGGAPGWAWLFLAAVVLFGLVIWLGIQVIRLRMEASINRRVIASLQKSRSPGVARLSWVRVAEVVRLLCYGAIALVVLVLCYLALGG